MHYLCPVFKISSMTYKELIINISALEVFFFFLDIAFLKRKANFLTSKAVFLGTGRTLIVPTFSLFSIEQSKLAENQII